MPVTLTRGKIHVKQANGQYAAYDAITDGTQASLIAEWTALWDEATSKINTVTDSLPAEYTEAVNEMQEINAQAVPITSATIDSILNNGGEA